MKPFIDLHTHTTYSQLDGMIRLEDYIQFAKDNELEAISITDHGNMDGAINFYLECKKHDVKPIIGSEFYCSIGLHDVNDAETKMNFHLILLAKNFTGYKNLVKLTTYANIENFYRKPRITFDKLKEYSEGLICTTACVGSELAYYINNDMTDRAYETATKYKALFGSDFYIEFGYHEFESEETCVNGLYELARKLNIRTIIANDTHYMKKEDELAHKILMCKGEKQTINDASVFDYTHNYYKSREEIIEMFSKFPQIDVETCINNIYDIIRKIEPYDIKFEEYIFPEFPTPNHESQKVYLINSIKEGMLTRYGTIEPSQEIRDRLNYEFRVICNMNFCGYFNIVADYVNWAKKNDVVVGTGRGSVAGCLIAYVLGITEVDSLKYDLLFERFLNPDRVSFPDIDMDFESSKRPLVINYLREKYGIYGAVPISTKGYLKGKSTIKTVASRLGYDFSIFNSVLSSIKDPKIDSIEKLIESSQTIKDLYETDDNWKKVIDLAKKLEGNIQSTGVHAAGIIICHKDVSDIIPIVHTKDGLATAYSDKIVEKLGLIKYDVLGLSNLTVIDNCLHRINQDIDINKIPLDDKATYDLLKTGESNGIFQLESSGMKSLLKRLQPSSIDHVDAVVALFRPGSMQFIDEYIRNKNNPEGVEYFDPRVEDILKLTYGQMVYQEQVMKLAQVLAGYTLGEADSLRKAIGKKNMEDMKKHTNQFIEGCVKGGMQE